MKNILFSVIIVSYKNLKVLINCIDSIYQYNEIEDKLEIIVVDNSPEDNIYRYIKVNYPGVRILKSNNRGFGAANNLGANIAKGKYLLFLNPDTLLIEPIFKFAIEQFEKDDKLALFGVKMLDENLKRNTSFAFLDKKGFFAVLFTKLLNKADFFLESKMYIVGAAMFIRKNVFFEVGMFDENLFLYREEADLARRIKAYNYKIKYFKNKRLIHLGGKSSTDLSSTSKLSEQLKSTKYYCQKYGIDYNKMILKEIRYLKFKRFVYKMINQHKCDEIEIYINILKESMQ